LLKKKLLWAFALIATTSSFVSAGSLVEPKASTTDLEIKKESRIIGGTKAPFGAWPSTVALLDAAKIQQIESGSTNIPFDEANYQAQFCGATLISSKWVLTAAHCVVDGTTGLKSSPSSIKALHGTSDLMDGGIRNNIRRIIVHPAYNYQTSDADIALLELVYHSGVRTIPVSGDDAPVGLLATVVGWGATNKNENYFPEELYEVELPIVNRSICEGIYGTTEFTQNMICAGYSQGGKDTCKSDSGGPLMGIQYGEYVQVGITSWGVGCAQAGFYGAYTRLSQFDHWINSYTGNSSNRGGGYESWSRFYTPDNSGGGSLYFLLFPLSLLLLRRKVKGAV